MLIVALARLGTPKSLARIVTDFFLKITYYDSHEDNRPGVRFVSGPLLWIII